MRPAIIICVVAALATAVASAQATSVLVGTAHVIDGDTIIVAGEHVRLEGIDAPERNQTCQREGKVWACGSVATQTLRGLIRNQEVLCNVVGRVSKICLSINQTYNSTQGSSTYPFTT